MALRTICAYRFSDTGLCDFGLRFSHTFLVDECFKRVEIREIKETMGKWQKRCRINDVTRNWTKEIIPDISIRANIKLGVYFDYYFTQATTIHGNFGTYN